MSTIVSWQFLSFEDLTVNSSHQQQLFQLQSSLTHSCTHQGHEFSLELGMALAKQLLTTNAGLPYFFHLCLLDSFLITLLVFGQPTFPSPHPPCLFFSAHGGFRIQTPDTIFFGSILWCRESADDPYIYLAKFGFSLNMKVKNFKRPSTFFATNLNRVEKFEPLHNH
jgi:hypothetical protein